MSRRMTRSLAAAMLLVVALLVAACGSSSGGDNGNGNGTSASDSTTGTTGGESAGPDQAITVASGAEAESLDPQSKDDDGMIIVLWRVYEGLYDIDVDGQIAPLLADGQPTPVDDTTWEVKLRSGVQFSDGQPFNADSAVSSIERIISAKQATGFSEAATIAGAEKVDDLTIRIKTKAPDAVLPNRLAVIKMLPSKLPDGFPETAVGTGPYLLKSYSAGGNAELEVNPSYWGEKPQVTKVTIRNIPDEGTRLQALTTGEVDIVPGLSPDQADKAPNFVATEKPVYVGLVRPNAIEGVTADVRVRQAISHSIDRESLAESIFSGNAVASSCQPTPVHVGDSSLKDLAYDPEKAKQLVEEAGATGKTVDLTWTTGVFPQDRLIGQAIAQQIEASGLKVNLQLKGYKAFLEDIYAHGPEAPDMVFTESDNNLASPASKVGLFFASDGPVAAIQDPELDALLKTASTEADPTASKEAYNAVLKRACDEVALITVYERRELYGLSDRVEFTPNPVAYSKIYYDQVKVVKPSN